MASILQNQGSVIAWKRLGRRIFDGELPADLAPGGGAAAFITSIQVNDHDVTGKVICLNNRRILYEFGKGFGTIKIDGNLFLGPNYKGSDTNDADLSSIIDWFNEKRVSTLKDSIVVTAGNHGTYKFVVTSFLINGVDPSIDLLQFSIVGDLIEIV